MASSAAASGGSGGSGGTVSPIVDKTASAAARMSVLDHKELEELTDTDHIIDWVSAFIADRKFVVEIERFTDEHAAAFEGLDPTGGEFSLEHTELYNKYLALAETKLEEFLSSKKVTPSEFYKLCREELERSAKAGIFSTRAVFVELLLACSEFTAFAAMMASAREAAKRARDGLIAAVEQLDKFLDDESNTKEADEDDLEAAREIVNDARKFVKDNPKASMTEVISQQLEMDTSLRPILERYVGTGATIADMFTLANSFV